MADVVLAVVVAAALALDAAVVFAVEDPVVSLAFALDAAVVFAVDEPVVSFAFAAARARVIRFGGDWGASILGRNDGGVVVTES